LYILRLKDEKYWDGINNVLKLCLFESYIEAKGVKKIMGCVLLRMN